MELIIIKRDSPEWEFMWDWLTNHPLNKDLPEPTVAENNGETWQYMGSYKSKLAVVHEFRHRCHPSNNSIQSMSLRARDIIPDDQIEKTSKII